MNRSIIITLTLLVLSLCLKLNAQEQNQTIVITANQDKAALAFDFGVLDFITKPILTKRFKLAIDRFLNDGGSFIQREKLKYLSIKSAGVVELIPLENVEFIKASGNYSEVYTSEQSCLLHDKNLDKLLKILPDSFIRIHRSYVVAEHKIIKVIKHGGGKYSVAHTNGKLLPQSRDVYKQKFR